jgi:hypothetical protein
MTYRFEIKDMVLFVNNLGKIQISYYGKDGKELKPAQQNQLAIA